MAEALHTLSDVFISAFLLFAAYWSQKPADEFHMFGHGRAQNVAALVSATIFISFISLEMFREAVPRIFKPEPNGFQNTTLALGVTVMAMIVSAIPLIDMLRTGERGATVKAQLVALTKDEISYVFALVGVVLVGRGYYLADPIATLMVAVIIAFRGLYLFRENFHYLVGRAPNKELMDNIESLARSVDGVLGVHDVRAEFIGPGTIHAGLHIEVAYGVPIEDADRIAEEVKDKISRETGCRYCVVHVDPKMVH